MKMYNKGIQKLKNDNFDPPKNEYYVKKILLKSKLKILDTRDVMKYITRYCFPKIWMQRTSNCYCGKNPICRYSNAYKIHPDTLWALNDP